LEKLFAEFKYFCGPSLVENCNPKFAWCVTCVW